MKTETAVSEEWGFESNNLIRLYALFLSFCYRQENPKIVGYYPFIGYVISLDCGHKPSSGHSLVSQNKLRSRREKIDIELLFQKTESTAGPGDHFEDIDWVLVAIQTLTSTGRWMVSCDVQFYVSITTEAL
jgi:hypothetical protein